MTAPASLLAARLDATIKRIALERMTVKAIYLSADDRAIAERDGIVDEGPRYRGIPVRHSRDRRGSMIYTNRNLGRAVRS